MNRRNFLSAIPVIAPAAMLLADPAPPKDELQYKGYRVFWADFMRSQENDRYIGHWLGWPLDAKKQMDGGKFNIFVVSMTTGWTELYCPGATFYTGRLPGRKEITHGSPQSDRDEVKQQAYDALIAFIDNQEKP